MISRATSWTVYFPPAVFVTLAVFGASLFGISTRPVGFLAQIWPANAILLGLFVRLPCLATRSSWAAAYVAFVAADLITGSSLDKALWLTTANLAGVLGGWLAFLRMPEPGRNLSEPASCLYLLAGAVVASLSAAAVGCWVAEPLVHVPMLEGFAFWFATELVNYLVILPAMLSRDLPQRLGRLRSGLLLVRRSDVLPAATLLLSIVVASLVGGPGAIAFPVPAMLWCAIRYSVTTTAILTALVCIWQVVSVTPLIGGAVADPVFSSISVRLGVALFSLAPLTVAATNASREKLVAELRLSLSRDALTRTMTRTAFAEKVHETMSSGGRFAMLVADIDHFKAVNDTYGHLAGDHVLKVFGECVMLQIRPGDFVGRLGGEEFGIVLRNVDKHAAERIANRIRLSVSRLLVNSGEHDIRVTVSIGIAEYMQGDTQATLLDNADKALYQAKNSGRNQVSLYHTQPA